MTTTATASMRINSEYYDTRLPHCAVCDGRVDYIRGPARLAEMHKRLVKHLGQHGLVAELCPGSAQPVKGVRR